MWYGMVEVCEGAPVAVGGWVLTDRHDLAPCAANRHDLAPCAANRHDVAPCAANRHDVAPCAANRHDLAPCAANSLHRHTTANLDLMRAPSVFYGVKYIDPVSLARLAGLHGRGE